MDTQIEIRFQKERREQLVRHIAFLYATRREVTAQIENAEKEIEIIERYIAMLEKRKLTA